MKRKIQEEESNLGSPGWMATYGDMVTLLLCFFVLLFALSTIDMQKFKIIMSSFQNSLGVLEAGKTIENEELINDALNEDRTTKQHGNKAKNRRVDIVILRTEFVHTEPYY